jgi:hypothetical protein
MMLALGIRKVLTELQGELLIWFVMDAFVVFEVLLFQQVTVFYEHGRE